MTTRKNVFCSKKKIFSKQKIICSPRREQQAPWMHNATASVVMLVHCLCSCILHQSPSSVLTQSLWLGNAVRERRWQWLLSCCVSQQSQDRCASMGGFSPHRCSYCANWMRGWGENESAAISGDSGYTYIEAAGGCKSSRCVSTADEGEGRKLNPTWHCEPLAILWGRKRLLYLQYRVSSPVAV